MFLVKIPIVGRNFFVILFPVLWVAFGFVRFNRFPATWLQRQARIEIETLVEQLSLIFF